MTTQKGQSMLKPTGRCYEPQICSKTKVCPVNLNENSARFLKGLLFLFVYTLTENKNYFVTGPPI